MKKIEEKPMDESVGENQVEDEESGNEGFEDDSEEDPTFDILEETRSGFSKLSLKKSKSRISKVIDSGSQEEADDVEVKLPELDAKDLKSFENVEKMIAAGQLEKLKVDQCKVYLRKNGLRLTGNKDVLIERIREHLGIINGGGEQKYPVSSFVMNCKGWDACTGDIVLFEQNVYEMYNIASRSATGPPCGTRIVAGRIVKESYGSAKQQHTFTIEVLWSKGVKPLPPLHPLLIKGRNLYRLQTVRQLWADEEERRKVLQEKHSRGSLARSNRETRIQDKETRNMLRGQRVTRNESNTTQEQKRRLQPDPFRTDISSPPAVQPQKQQKVVDPVIYRNQPTQFEQHKPSFPPNTVLTEICQQNNNSQLEPNVIKSENSNILNPSSVRYQNSNITEQHHNGIRRVENHQSNGFHFANNTQNHFSGEVHQSHDSNANITELYHNGIREVGNHRSNGFHVANNTQSHFSGIDHQSHHANGRGPMERQVCHYYAQGRCRFGANCKYLHEDRGKSVNDESICMSPTRGRAPMQRQVCQYYAKGKCYFGENCKYLHEDGEKRVNNERITAEKSFPNGNGSNSNCPWSPTCRSFKSPHPSPTRRSFNSPLHSPTRRSVNSPPWSPTRRSFNSPLRSPTRRSFNAPPWSPNHGRVPMQRQVCHYDAHGSLQLAACSCRLLST
ncbi:zinc finger protein [Macleaya cordata]|uniref:Zinc finger protein n=1 Tax=Macleaya cordata TaxID=56857 RepID=A0A200QCZ2_MACCD|nr:zinc finger protein [Macleaya cordata]